MWEHPGTWHSVLAAGGGQTPVLHCLPVPRPHSPAALPAEQGHEVPGRVQGLLCRPGCGGRLGQSGCHLGAPS
eukprot:10548912-Lingulodinium_polyedra.AAC.1